MDLSTTMLISLVCEMSLTADLSAEPSSTLKLTLSDKLADGVAADQADLLYFDSDTCLASATTPYDLDTSLTDVYGVAADFARVKAVMFENTSATLATFEVGPHSNGTPWAGCLTSAGGATGNEAEVVLPGGAFLWYTPDATAWAVGAGATDILEIFESAVLAGAWDIMFIGATA